MDNDLQKQIEERLAKLPDNVRQAVLSSNWEQKVQTLGAKHALHIDQVGALGDVTLMTMLGFFDASDMPGQVAQELAVPPEQAQKISADVSNEIFMPIRDSMKKFVSEAPQPVPPPDLHAADMMLTQKTVTLPPAASKEVKPQNYSADPYREPPV